MEIHENLELENLVIDGEEEVWKQINQFEGLENVRDMYYVSNFGRIKSIGGRKGDRVMKQSENTCGYLFIGLRLLDGKQKFVLTHRLVAFAFVSDYKDGLVCNHLDEQKENNHYNNLEWCTQKQNVNHGTRNERSAEKQSMAVIGTCVKTGEVIEFKSIQHAGRCGFHSSAVSNACRGRYAKDCKHGGTDVFKGYRWSYAESA